MRPIAAYFGGHYFDESVLFLNGYLASRLQNMIRNIALTFILSIIILAGGSHPLHVSVTEIEMDSKDKRLEIMMRVFVDDFETSLRQKLNQPEWEILPLSEEERDKLISAYLNEHFKIWLDSKSQKIKYLGHETENDAFIFYIEIPNVKKWKSIEIHNDIIMQVYSDQSNLVHVTVQETVKSLRLTKNNPTDKLAFDF
jgi:hypothetical protein